jgi:membrane protein implicated in regulation of membrane protease activity
MEKTKYFFLIAAIFGQMIGFILLFVNVELALLFFAIYAVNASNLTVLAYKRKEKRKKGGRSK